MSSFFWTTTQGKIHPSFSTQKKMKKPSLFEGKKVIMRAVEIGIRGKTQETLDLRFLHAPRRMACSPDSCGFVMAQTGDYRRQLVSYEKKTKK
jgi:hypothetical protein